LILLLRRKLVSADILDEALTNGDKSTVVRSVLENKISMAEMVLEISLDLFGPIHYLVQKQELI
jgi:hypothetical protein